MKGQKVNAGKHVRSWTRQLLKRQLQQRTWDSDQDERIARILCNNYCREIENDAGIESNRVVYSNSVISQGLDHSATIPTSTAYNGSSRRGMITVEVKNSRQT
jgi:hypothetical protein